ncbi:MAG TPA: sigma 54-interacting transcriptional regulator [Polyangiaceae bacterium]
MTSRDRDDTATHVLGGEATLRVHAATLDVASGPDAGRQARVDRPTFVVGSGPGADLRLTDGAVSREHVRLSLEPAGVRVRDEGSKNGTWIGGLRVTEVLLTADTAIELGKTRLLVRVEAAPLDLPLSASASFGDAIGVSATMRHLFAVLERGAQSDVTVLLEGESGVGKEVLARAVHARSGRAAGPFVALDCGAIPAGLVESELFGHERGAFTGATHTRSGVFQDADGGTLFLDEIGELPVELQPKLLRVLETREVRPVGGRGARQVDVRIVAATNRRLAEAAAAGEFRLDLFYRLAVARVVVPPLRDRREDIVPLARAFLRSATGDARVELPADLAAMLESYAWPGNVRELRNVIERWALLGLRDARALFDAGGLAAGAGGGTTEDLSHLPYHEARRIVLERFERAYLPRVLENAGGVIARAAESAQVARPSFYRMLQRIGRGSEED